MWSLLPGVEWAVEVMLDEGIEYDSSILPAGKGDPKTPFVLRCGDVTILEVPPMPMRLRSVFGPLAAGFVFRFLPWFLYNTLLRREGRRTEYLHVYIHPWELAAKNHDLNGIGLAKRLFFTRGRQGRDAKFRRFVQEFGVTSIAEAMDSIRKRATQCLSLDDIRCYSFNVPKHGMLELFFGSNGGHSRRTTSP